MTTLRLPRHTKGRAPDAETLARLIAHDVGVPLSWVTDVNRSELVVDLFDTDLTVALDAVNRYMDAHDIDWELLA